MWWIGPANLLCAFLLFVYSTTFKKRFLSGNVIIALFTAWTLAVLGLAIVLQAWILMIPNALAVKARILRFTLLYAAFAFIISLIREAIKDMEDMRGDAQYGCKTLPIVAGIKPQKLMCWYGWWCLIGALVTGAVLCSATGLVAGGSIYDCFYRLRRWYICFYKFVKVSQRRSTTALSRLPKLVMSRVFCRCCFLKFICSMAEFILASGSPTA